MLTIGSLELASQVVLAPMCGICDIPYLQVMRRFDSRSLIFHEMFSAAALVYGQDRRGWDIPSGIRPMGLQLFGHEPTIMAQAARMLADAGADLVDLNLGCPAPKIAKNCDGSALLKDVKLLEKILQAMVAAVGSRLPVTIKMRLGWSDQERNYLEVARVAEASGVSAITVHGRTRSQMYSGRADWQAIGEVAQSVRVPVIGNGDVSDPEGAALCLKESGCAGVMVGRAAQGNPWLTARIRSYLESGTKVGEPSPAERVAVAIEHCRLLVRSKGEAIGVPQCRKHVAWYTRGLPGSATLRAQINVAKTIDELERALRGHLAALHSNFDGFEPCTSP